ncbi:hypothetical protein [Fulvivirga sp. M361]|uniref:hypothetical protein n=1 Tax=Fulvivirga sp. M361 TaxID=2594266 RepID=UPI0016245DA0|nr:hypothetical protein [Fulvivirga sp. M361]
MRLLNKVTLLLVLGFGSLLSTTGCMNEEIIEPQEDASTLSSGGEEEDDPIEPFPV